MYFHIENAFGSDPTMIARWLDAFVIFPPTEKDVGYEQVRPLWRWIGESGTERAAGLSGNESAHMRVFDRWIGVGGWLVAQQRERSAKIKLKIKKTVFEN